MPLTAYNTAVFKHFKTRTPLCVAAGTSTHDRSGISILLFTSGSSEARRWCVLLSTATLDKTQALFAVWTGAQSIFGKYFSLIQFLDDIHITFLVDSAPLHAANVQEITIYSRCCRTLPAAVLCIKGIAARPRLASQNPFYRLQIS